MQPLQNCIGPTIRIGREILCLPYAGFFYCMVGSEAMAIQWGGFFIGCSYHRREGFLTFWGNCA